MENAFAAWMRRHNLTAKRVSKVIGCSVNSVTARKRRTPPRYILLACAAYSVGLAPVV
jgi:hypothetical protein